MNFSSSFFKNNQLQTLGLSVNGAIDYRAIRVILMGVWR